MDAWSIDIVKTFFNKGVKAIAKWLSKLWFLSIDLLNGVLIFSSPRSVPNSDSDTTLLPSAAGWPCLRAIKKEIHDVAGFSGLTRDAQSYVCAVRNATLRVSASPSKLREDCGS